MIRKRTVILRGVCDACGKDLSSEDQKNDDGTPSDVHCGILKSNFGWGSPFDGEETFEVCEACWEKALWALGIPLFHDTRTAPLYVREEAFLLEGGDKGEICVKPVWRCRFCDFTSRDKGRSMPVHVCEAWESAIDRARKVCPQCQVDGKPFRRVEDGKGVWKHFEIKPGEVAGRLIECKASDLLEKAIRPELRGNHE